MDGSNAVRVFFELLIYGMTGALVVLLFRQALGWGLKPRMNVARLRQARPVEREIHPE
jgi:hypothetical protein